MLFIFKRAPTAQAAFSSVPAHLILSVCVPMTWQVYRRIGHSTASPQSAMNEPISAHCVCYSSPREVGDQGRFTKFSICFTTAV
jgi:hypothetical protein